MKNILIIGGSYFLGRVFTETLLSNGGYGITVLNRGRIPFRNPKVNEIICDRHDGDGLAEALPPAEWDAVVDFCAYRPEDTDRLIEVLRRSIVRRYILISSVSVYRNQSPVIPLTENAALLDSPLPETEDPEAYVWNKMNTENGLIRRCTEAGIEYTVLRPAIIFGKYNYAPRESFFFDRIIAGDEIIIPAELKAAPAAYSFVSVWDAAALAARCIDSSDAAGKAFNLAAPEQITYGLLADAIRKASGRDLRIRRMSISELYEKRIPLPFPPDKSLLYSGSCIAETLQFKYHSFDEEMKRTWKYYLLGRGLDPLSLKPAES